MDKELPISTQKEIELTKYIKEIELLKHKIKAIEKNHALLHRILVTTKSNKSYPNQPLKGHIYSDDLPVHFKSEVYQSKFHHGVTPVGLGVFTSEASNKDY